MKTIGNFISILALVAGFTFSSYAEKGPVDPAGPGNGIIGFDIGPGIHWYDANGFGPALMIHYDHSIWQAGPGTISLGGQMGFSYFSDKYIYNDANYYYHWMNMGFVFRGAYHYGWKVQGLDTYAGFGMGTWVSFFDDTGNLNGKAATSIGFLPTFFFGASYFFNPVVGVNAETGYNFSFFAVGMNFRMVRSHH
jgi:hypothetical protein